MTENGSAEIESRSLILPSGDISLEAILHVPASIEPAGLLVVCHPNPQRGGSMDNNVVYALCEAALQEGMAALRFNFRGVGLSGGQFEAGHGEAGDVEAALAAAASMPGGARLGLAGYSFGATMALFGGCRQPALGLRAVILVSPPVQSIDTAALQQCPRSRLFLAGDRDPVCPAEMLEAIADALEPRAERRIVEGADHFWQGYESELRDTVGSFLRWYVAAN